MKGKPIWSIFWALVGVIVITVIVGVIQAYTPPLHRLLMPAGGWTLLCLVLIYSAVVVLIGLGVTLLVLTAKTKVRGILKKFLLLTEASFVGLLVFGTLAGGMEGLLPKEHPLFLDWVLGFFMFMALVCMPAFLVGAVGTIVLAIKKSRRARQSPSI